MDIEERIAKAKEVLGDRLKIVRRGKGGGKPRPCKTVFTPKSKKRRRDMSRSEYSQCGKKIRYRTHADAVKAMQSCERARGRKLRIYQCPVCLGFHLSHSFRFGPDGA